MNQFSSLPSEERIEAILAVVREPCTLDLVCKYAGVNLHEVDETIHQKIEDLFRRSKVPLPSGDERPRYWISPEQQSIVLERLAIDIETVRRNIASFGLERYGRNKTK